MTSAERAERRDAVASEIYSGIRNGSLLATYEDMGDDEDQRRYERTLDRILAAALGEPPPEDEEDE